MLLLCRCAGIGRLVAACTLFGRAEEHNRYGGLGESVAQVLSVNYPVAQEFVAVNDTFGESGTPEQLMEKYGLTTEAIVKAARKAVERRKTQAQLV